MPQTSTPQQGRRRRWLRVAIWLLLAVLLMLALAALASLLARSGVDPVSLGQTVASLKPYGIAAQALVIALVGIRWSVIVHWGRRKGIVKAHEFDQVMALRAKVMAFLLAYLLLIPIGPAGILRALGMGT